MVDLTAVHGALPSQRLAAYVKRADGDVELAMDYYRWSHALASECWTLISHFEVLLRHRIDTVLADHLRETDRHIPWFLQMGDLPGASARQIDDTITRLRTQGRLSRHQVVAGMTFGFWATLFSDDNLWKEALHQVFTDRSGLKRKDVTSQLEGVRRFRNRVAHHDSLLNVDVPMEISSILSLTRRMDVEYADWMSTISAWADVYSESPYKPKDTVVVAAAAAWTMYQDMTRDASLGTAAYICQAGRFFRPVERLAFYADQAVQPELPALHARRDHVEWTLQNAAVLERSDSREDKKIGRLIRWTVEGPGRGFGYEEGGRYQVLLLSRPSASRAVGEGVRHKSLSRPVPHRVAGRGSAFTQRQRYVASHALETAVDTSELTDT
ncbi:Abi-like protein [Micrococcus luteus]|uniref:Abi family protein n=1 Tax=Micrococcus luteus TaxID=1270 RepID=UPI000DF9F2C2|nr:Abi family protein [Micrococcus luteus]STY73247.1 Abi-like protein [Micrococcus luteus]